MRLPLISLRAPISLRFLLVAALLPVLMFVHLPGMARAQSWLEQPFDATTLSREDTATLQASLAWTGDFFGVIDGIWTPQSQEAFVKYATRTAGRETVPRFSDIKDLVMFLEDERVRNDWQLNYSRIANTSYLFPFGLIEEVKDAREMEYLSKDKSISLIIREGKLADAKSDHDWFLGKARADTKPYQFSNDQTMISWVDLDNKMTAYIRSDLHDGLWSTMNFVTTEDGYFRVNLLAGSTVTGNASAASLIWTPGGVIDQVINGTAAAAPPTAAAAAAPRAEDQVERPGKSAVTSPTMPDSIPAMPPEASHPTPPKDIPGDLVEDLPPASDAPASGILGTPAPGTATADAGPVPGGLGTPAPALPDAPDPGTAIASGPAELGTAPGGPAPIRAPEGQPAAPAGGPKVAAVAETPRPKIDGTLKSSGTGFYIAPTTLVTAAHVIEGCSAIGMADGTALEVLAADTTLDVAVLGGAVDTGAWLKLSALEVPKLGETVTTLGYPYSTSLDQGLTVTSGNVSALRGADGSSNRVMISAPVQPGNSGGPLLNKKGAVIGVVVSRVDDIAMLEETGTLPQNMNFAVPSGPLLTFLARERISRPQGEGVRGDLSAELPEAFAAAVVPVRCYR
ncbi:trypsin-like peptidase domain-containing protein [Pseudomonas sp. GX19020]|uniref:S1C family serine protease n=1 Tax=Pseudomonas sp. GX19020 TaxID=2942277 RepID=UPI002019CFCA|nr:serine protease [Pseudomonas sp. GX19020]MCL4066560.1 trypsin-like peptidase domain-containing protein [Pseudomonas sp. GX19020]